MSIADTLILIIYGFALTMLIIFGLHKYFLLYLFRKYRNAPVYVVSELTEKPLVTVQLPIFNERYVVERLIKAVCEMDYPRELLEIQVLDDSTDETAVIAERLTDNYRKAGFNIQYIHRKDRTGFKAGALDNGMRLARGDLLAIFDADFVPSRDFLNRSLPYFQHSELGMVQTRWGHINRKYSFLTRVQSMFLDGHFVIEHVARNRSGRFFNFNGTAGIWRKQAIVDAGGWQHDTLTEDLDLSYRAQMAGWKFVYVPDIIAPAELPVEMNAYKSQQHRWAKGSVQTAKKLLPKIIRSDLPLFVKLEASVHLFSNFTYLFMTIPSLLMPVVLHIQLTRGWDWMVYVYLLAFFATSLSVVVYYLVSQRFVYPDWKKQIPYMPLLMSLGIGLSINNARAVIEAISNYKTEFKRTPKYRIEGQQDGWHNKKYRMKLKIQPFVELLIGAYFTVSMFALLREGLFVSIPFFILFQFGFLYIGAASLIQSGIFRIPMQPVRHLIQNRLLYPRKASLERQN